MKKSNLILSIFLSVILMNLSCNNDNLENFNVNPNEPEIVPPHTIFNRATKQFTDFSRNSFNSGRLTLNWMEYWGQNSYADEDRYLYRETSAQSLYQNTYLVANDLKAIIDLNTNEETRDEASAVGNNNNQIAASRIMLAYIFHQLTNTFGDVPYYSYGTEDPDFQALNIDEILSPAFADQEKIYADILKELREAADMLVLSEPVFTRGDNIYDGDASKWRKFANSLILRIANNMRSANPAAAGTAMEAAIASGVFTSNSDNAVQAYETADATSSPMWSAFIERTDFAVTAPFVDLLKGISGNFSPDPRLFEMVAPIYASIESVKENNYAASEDYDDYLGVPYAYQNANALPFNTYSFPSSKVLKPDYGEVLMEYAEVAFILSEYNNWDQAEYEKGVEASMEKWGVEADNINDYMAALPPANAENVMTQKYIALYMQAHQAWAEYRRTGYPNTLFLPGDTYTLPPIQAAAAGENSYTFEAGEPLQDLPSRLRYPVSLQTLNGDNRAAAVAKLSNGDNLDSKLFWDVN